MALLMMLFGACARLRCLFNEAAPVADVYQERNSCFEGFRQCNCTPGLGPEICSGWSKYQTPTVAPAVGLPFMASSWIEVCLHASMFDRASVRWRVAFVMPRLPGPLLYARVSFFSLAVSADFSPCCAYLPSCRFWVASSSRG